MSATCYALYGGHPSEAYVLDRRPEGWVVYYAERGLETSLTVFDSEAAACNELLALVASQDHCFFQLVAGPAPAAEADEAFAAWLNARAVAASQLEHSDWKTDEVPWTAGPYWRRYFVRTTTVRRLERGLVPERTDP